MLLEKSSSFLLFRDFSAQVNGFPAYSFVMALAAARGKLIGVIGDEVDFAVENGFLNPVMFRLSSSFAAGHLRRVPSRGRRRDEQEQAAELYGGQQG